MTIGRAPVPDALDGGTRCGPTWYLAGDHFLLEVPAVARMLVSAGRDITVAVADGATDADAAPFLCGTAMGAILHQRSELVLHAAVVAHRGRAVALCGPSGVGKSTLAAALCRAGCTFVSDDVSVIRFAATSGASGDTSETHPLVVGDGRAHRLWQDAAEHLDLTEHLGPPVRPAIAKYHVPPAAGPSAAPLPLATVVILVRDEVDVPPTFLRLALADAAPLLRRQVYRSLLASRMGRDGALFAQIARLLAHVPVWRHGRRMEMARLDASVAAVLARLEGTA